MEINEKRITQKYIELKTDKGFELSYLKVPMDEIVFFDKKLLESEPIDKGSEPKVKSMTQLSIWCNFEATTEMCNRLDQSKILIIEHLGISRDDDEKISGSVISFYVKPMFSYNLLNDLLCDMCVTFGLQSKSE